MLSSVLAAIFVIGIQFGSFHPQITIPPVIIDTPQDGDVLQGIVPIQAQVDLDKVDQISVYFGYEDDTSGSWFLIAENKPAVDGLLANWDTSLITDGTYQLLVQAELPDGSNLQFRKNGLQVQNYTIIQPTATSDTNLNPLSPQTEATVTEGAPLQEATDGPVYIANPGAVTKQAWSNSALRGAGFSLLVILVLGFYLTLKRFSRS